MAKLFRLWSNENKRAKHIDKMLTLYYNTLKLKNVFKDKLIDYENTTDINHV